VDQRHEWFREGARAFRHVQEHHGRAHLLPSAADLYPCPLCLTGFYTIAAIETGELTREHVPPRSLGGGWLVLTCRECNNDSGRFYDAEAEKQERMRSFLAGRHEGPVRGTYAVNGVVHRGEIHLGAMLGDGPAPITFVGPDAVNVGDPVVIPTTNAGVGMYFQSVSRINNPPDAQQFDQVLSDAIDNREQITLSFAPQFRFSPDRARVSWIRSAYLVAFAALGWSYVLRPQLVPLREQFQAHEGAALPEIALYDPQADPERRELLIVSEPSDCASVLVVIGGQILFLPRPGGPRSVVDLADAVQARYQDAASSQTPLTFFGTPLPWPTKPDYGLDRSGIPSPAAARAGS